MTFVSYIYPTLSALTLVGAAIVAYFHYRLESRLGEFRQSLVDKLDEKFISKPENELQFKLICEKVDSLRREIMFRLEAGSDDHR